MILAENEGNFIVLRNDLYLCAKIVVKRVCHENYILP